MPRTYSSIDKIRAELAWVNETPDPNKCGCRNVRCCEETGHKPGACAAVWSQPLFVPRSSLFSCQHQPAAAEARLEGLIGTDVQSLWLPRAWSRLACEVLHVIACVILARQISCEKIFRSK